MEIYLKTDKETLRLPVIPSEFERNTSANIQTQSIANGNDVSFFSGIGLTEINLSSFFPNQEYSFCDYKGFPKPYDCVTMVNNWKNKGTVVRLIITGVLNQQMLIKSLDYGEKDGTSDVYYSIDLIEYRPITVPKIASATTKPNTNNSRPTTKPPATTSKTHKVVKGDSLWAIAQKYYGKGSLYPKIKEANKKKYPSLAKNNTIYPNWELII